MNEDINVTTNNEVAFEESIPESTNNPVETTPKATKGEMALAAGLLFAAGYGIAAAGHKLYKFGKRKYKDFKEFSDKKKAEKKQEEYEKNDDVVEAEYHEVK